MKTAPLSTQYFKARATLLRMVTHMRRDWSMPPAASGLKPGVNRDRRLKLAILDLPTVMGPTGFDATADRVLDHFRRVLAECARGTTEGDVLMKLVGVDPQQITKVTEAQAAFLATLKLLRHSYRVQRAGGQTIWMVTLPKNFYAYAFEEFQSAGGSAVGTRYRLNQTDDYFDADQRRSLAIAAADARLWCQQAQSDLREAQRKDSPKRQAVRKWFAGAQASDDAVDLLIRRLYWGYDDMIKPLADNQLMFGDDPSERDQPKTSASVFAEDTLPVINIQGNMFTRTFRRYSKRVFWGLTIVHEMSHVALRTKDNRYDFEKLQVGTGFSSARAMDNADSWAYFAASAAGVISDSQQHWALCGHAHPMADLELDDLEV